MVTPREDPRTTPPGTPRPRKYHFRRAARGVEKTLARRVCRPFLRSLIYAASRRVATNIKKEKKKGKNPLAPRVPSLPCPPRAAANSSGAVSQSERSDDAAGSTEIVSPRKLPNLNAGPNGSPFLRGDVNGSADRRVDFAATEVTEVASRPVRLPRERWRAELRRSASHTLVSGREARRDARPRCKSKRAARMRVCTQRRHGTAIYRRVYRRRETAAKSNGARCEIITHYPGSAVRARVVKCEPVFSRGPSSSETRSKRKPRADLNAKKLTRERI